MNGTPYEADYIVAWPTAEIAVMGPDGMVRITMRKQLEIIPEGPERDQAAISMADEFRKNIDPYIAAGHAQVDDVIDPADTRDVVIRFLEQARTRTAIGRHRLAGWPTKF
jgi:acetyl-CoA carboxylase carboxyltransferase component